MGLDNLLDREVKYKKPHWKVEHKGVVEEVNKLNGKASIRNLKNSRVYDIHIKHITGVKVEEGEDN